MIFCVVLSVREDKVKTRDLERKSTPSDRHARKQTEDANTTETIQLTRRVSFKKNTLYRTLEN